MSRWLVTLALAVVALPDAAGAGSGFRIDRATRTVTSSRELADRAARPRIARLPASVELDRGAVLVLTDRGLRVRHPVGDAGVSWLATVGSRVIVGYAARPGGHADSIVAIDHVTGRLAWRRAMDSLAAADLGGRWLAVERAGALDVIDARTGGTVGTAPLSGQGLLAVAGAAGPVLAASGAAAPGGGDGAAIGDILVKTRGDLVAIDALAGRVRWSRPASAVGNALIAPAAALGARGPALATRADHTGAATDAAVIDGWVDRDAHRFGIAGYDARTGQQIASIDLGATGGWYERERVDLSPDGPHDLLVSALFATS